jgi:hypothetical protein
MKAFRLGVMLALIALPAAAADVLTTHPRAATKVHAARPAYLTAPKDPLPLALRTLSRRSAAVMASLPCWHDCTATCGQSFQACIRVDWPKRCFAFNDACDLTCLKACRLLGGPLVSWTDY